MLLNQPILQHKFDQAMSYDAFIASGEPLGHRPQWDQRYSQLALDDAQQALVQSFTRHMPILTLTGTWCGDCALQGAALRRIAEAKPECFDLRFLPRVEDHADLITRCQINAGFRVPMVWILSEDLHPLAVLGDRPLSRYRAMALKALGERSNVHADPPADPVRTVLQELLDEIERTQLMLRLSPRLREKYRD